MKIIHAVFCLVSTCSLVVACSSSSEGSGPGGASTTGGVGTSGGSGGTSSSGGAASGGASTTGGVGTSGGSGGTSSSGGSGPGIGPLGLRGVNLSCAEWGESQLPGTFGTTYTYPDEAYVPGYDSPAYFVSKGVTVFRLPFRWERLQPTLNQDFDAAELGRLTTTVDHLLALGAWVIIDPHNYARYDDELIGSSAVPYAAFDDLWTRLATLYESEPKVIFGLMNEPNTMETEQWVTAANGAIAAIRTTGAENLILVPGNAWSNAASWTQNWYGTPNAQALLNIVDPGDNYAIEVHNYFNDLASSSEACISATIGAERLQGVTDWLHTNHLRGFVGEFSGNADDATCQSTVENMLNHIESNSDVYLGWAWWAAGPWWGDNWASIEPNGETDNPRMSWLEPYLD